jgi:hypothetical protein
MATTNSGRIQHLVAYPVSTHTGYHRANRLMTIVKDARGLAPDIKAAIDDWVLGRADQRTIPVHL